MRKGGVHNEIMYWTLSLSSPLLDRIPDVKGRVKYRGSLAMRLSGEC